MDEKMKDVPGYEGRYAVTKDGRVWSYPNPSRFKGRWMKGYKTPDGYIRVNLMNRGKRGTKEYLDHHLLHRLVAMTYMPKPPGNLEINHINGIKTDNSVKNLEWVTRIENHAHAWKLGLYKMTPEKIEKLRVMGIKGGKAKRKLTMGQARAIRRKYAQGGISMRAIGREYKMNHQCISWIISGHTYREVA